MMLTSVSSISTTIESNSERAAENFIGPVPHDKVDLTEMRLKDFPRVRLFLCRRSIARENPPSARQRLLPKIFRLRRKRPLRLREAQAVFDWSVRTRVRRVRRRAVHRAARHRDELRTTRPIHLVTRVNLAPQKQLPSTGQKHPLFARRNAGRDEACHQFQSDSVRAVTRRQIDGWQF